MKLEFTRENEELILIYYPELVDSERMLQELDEGHERHIRNCFTISKERLRLNPAQSNYDDDALYFCIGRVEEKYTKIDSDVIGTTNSFYFANEIPLTEEMFIASYHISVLRKIDNIVSTDIYVGASDDESINLPFTTFKELIKNFPKTSELRHYTNVRIARIIKEYFEEAESYEIRFRKFLEQRSKSNLQAIKNSGFAKQVNQIELAQFKLINEEIHYLLDNSEGIDEKTWQEKIHEIIRLLYPKYIFGVREITIRGIDDYDKCPDFLLVDANGYIDIMEIKKPSVQLLTKQSSYRNNYVPVRELAGTIQQIEKYIFCLNYWGKDGEKHLEKKFGSDLPNGVNPKIINPQGILILGRSNDFKPQQKSDFELIKRQYKHIADIMSYDDLVLRIENIISALEIALS